MFPRGPGERRLAVISQGDLSARSLTSRGMLRGGASRFPCRWVSNDLFPPRRKGHIGCPSIWMILLSESLPGKGNEGRWIAQWNLSIQQNVRGRFTHGRVDPRSHPFAPRVFPKEYRQSSWVEPWRFGFRSGSFPRRVGILLGYRASAGPGRLAILVFPFAEAMGNLDSVIILLRGSFPKAFPSTAPGGQFRDRC